MTAIRPFHIAFPVHDLDEARRFYGKTLGLAEGRCAETWIDFNLYGHQIVTHYKPPLENSLENAVEIPAHHNPVDGHDVPVPHFGVILTMDDWKALRDRLIAAEVQFKIEPYIRFEGEAGEQATMFFLDPSGNALEFKAFNELSQLFEK
jgi:extradiol dioxygenase family protein